MNYYSKTERELHTEIVKIEKLYPRRNYYNFFRLKLIYYLLKENGEVDNGHVSKSKKVKWASSDVIGSQTDAISVYDFVINAIGIIYFKLVVKICSSRKQNFNLHLFYRCLQIVKILSYVCYAPKNIATKPFYSNLRVLLSRETVITEIQHGMIFSFHAGYFPLPVSINKIVCSKPITPAALRLFTNAINIEGNTQQTSTLNIQRLGHIPEDTKKILIIDQPSYETRIKEFLNTVTEQCRHKYFVKLHPNRVNNPYEIKTEDMLHNIDVFVAVNSTLIFELPEDSRVFILGSQLVDIINDQ